MFAIWDNSFYRYFELPSDLLYHAVGPGDWQSIFDAWMIRMVMCSYYCSQMIKLSAMRYENCALLCCKQHDSEHTVEVPQYSAHPCVRVCVCLSVYEYIFCNFISQTQSARNYILKLRWLFVRFHFQFSTFILLAHHFCPYYNVCVCVYFSSVQSLHRRKRNWFYLRFVSLQASFQSFLFIGFASNLLDMFIRTTCHKKISGVNFFYSLWC